MVIRCWGSRGSIAVSGPQYLRYGGDTTCMEVRSQSGDVVIIDAGSGIRSLGLALTKEKVRKVHMFFTHAHFDHLMGLPFFALLFTPGVRIAIRGPRLDKKSIKDVISHFLDQPYFPVQLHDKDVHAKLTFADMDTARIRIGSMSVTPIHLSHPKNGGLGYRFEENGHSFVFLTDNELGYVHKGGRTFEEYASFCRGADLLIHDAEYTSEEYDHILKMSARPWGHSTYEGAVNLGLAAGVRQLGLFHLNQRRTDTAMDGIVRKAGRIIKAVGSDMSCFGVPAGFKCRL